MNLKHQIDTKSECRGKFLLIDKLNAAFNAEIQAQAIIISSNLTSVHE